MAELETEPQQASAVLAVVDHHKKTPQTAHLAKATLVVIAAVRQAQVLAAVVEQVVWVAMVHLLLVMVVMVALVLPRPSLVHQPITLAAVAVVEILALAALLLELAVMVVAAMAVEELLVLPQLPIRVAVVAAVVNLVAMELLVAPASSSSLTQVHLNLVVVLLHPLAETLSTHSHLADTCHLSFC